MRLDDPEVVDGTQKVFQLKAELLVVVLVEFGLQILWDRQFSDPFGDEGFGNGARSVVVEGDLFREECVTILND